MVIPKPIRRSRHWESGQQFAVEETNNGILLRPVNADIFPRTTLKQAAGCLQGAYSGKPKTLDEMDEAIKAGVAAQHDSN